MTFSGLIDNNKNLIYFFFILITSFPVLRNRNFWGARCPDFSSKTINATELKFSVQIDKVWLSSWLHFQFCGTETRLDPKFDEKISTKFLNILIYNFLLVNIFKTHIERKLFSLLSSIDWFQKIGPRALRLAWSVKFISIWISFYC